MRVFTYSSVWQCVSEISAESGLSVIGPAAADVTAAVALALSPGSGPGAGGAQHAALHKPTHALQSGHKSTLHTGHAAQRTLTQAVELDTLSHVRQASAHALDEVVSHRFSSFIGIVHTNAHDIPYIIILHKIRCCVQCQSCSFPYIDSEW